MENSKRLLRSTQDKWVGGVCGGLAAYFGWSSDVLRLIYVLLSIFTAFSGLLVYLCLWACMPEDNRRL